MNYRDVELTVGPTRIYSPPLSKIDAIVSGEIPLPEPERIEEELPSGKTIVAILDDDPDYLRELRIAEEKREERNRELMWLFTLRKIVPPDGWDIEEDMGEEIAYFDPDWKPREGKIGRKLDYIEWVVLSDGANVREINSVLNELAGISREVVALVEESFPGEVEGETPQVLAE